MTTQFFERQEVQRKHTRLLVGGFILAILLVVAVINLIVMVGIAGDPVYVVREHPQMIFWISGPVIVIILIASWHRSSQLRAGGAAVARSLGGVPVTAGESDLARKRLLNIVEEMAIAARIRKPQVFILPDEQGINAFAAGHSPDEAAVAVTQGALDKLDRDQLQAVIGHEFSHILNGDMQINMRLTAWLFGLYVITAVARRFLNRRGGKKDARIMLIALAIFVAGSVGMFAGRLLQAAVSRRREHLADASSVQFTRNPQALQGAFLTMAVSNEGTRLMHVEAGGCAHMFFAGSAPPWANKFGSWFATHPSLEERVRALDSKVTPLKFKTLLTDQRRKLAALAASEAANAVPESNAGQPARGASAPGIPLMAAAGMSAAAAAGIAHAGVAAFPAGVVPAAALAETLPSGVRLVAGRALPPDVLRNRLSKNQQASIVNFVAAVENSPHSVQAVFIAAMLASEPAKARTQLTRLAPSMGIDLLRETQAQLGPFAQLSPAARLPALTDLLTLLDALDSAQRKRLRAIARAFAPTVAAGDMLRYSVTRVLEKRLAKAVDQSPPVPLPDRAPALCQLYAALSHCRFGPGKQGQNAYRAGLMGLMPPQKWMPFPETPATPAELDTALASLAQVHPTGKRSLSEGMGRVIAVGGQLTVAQVDLLRGACLVLECPAPLLAIDVLFEEMPRSPAAVAG